MNRDWLDQYKGVEYLKNKKERDWKFIIGMIVLLAIFAVMGGAFWNMVGKQAQMVREEEQKEENEDEESKEESSDSENPEDNSSQGCYKIFDSGFEITVEDPFVVYYDPLSNNMTVTIPDDPSSRGYIFYDTSEQSMTQLETTVKSLESASEADPTITNMTKDVDEQENGMFSMTFTYSAGANEGSAAGFYFIHYQTTENGVINVNLFTTRSSNSEKILELIDSIQPATENAVEYSE